MKFDTRKLAWYNSWFNKELYKLQLSLYSAKFLHSVTAFALIQLWFDLDLFGFESSWEVLKYLIIVYL